MPRFQKLLSSLERSESYFELDGVHKEVPVGLCWAELPSAQSRSSSSHCSYLCCCQSHTGRVFICFSSGIPCILARSPAQVICGSVVMFFNERLCPHTLGTIPACSTPLVLLRSQVTQVSSPEMRSLIAHPVLMSLPSAWWPRQNCHKHFCGGCDSGSPACLPVG